MENPIVKYVESHGLEAYIIWPQGLKQARFFRKNEGPNGEVLYETEVEDLLNHTKAGTLETFIKGIIDKIVVQLGHGKE